jgi:hypothetical protein
MILVFAMIGMTVKAQGWEPYQFQGDEKYEFNIVTYEGGTPTEAYYAIDVKDKGNTNAAGQDVYDVIYATAGQVPKDDLGASTAFGFFAMPGFSLSMAFLNPMYAMFFTQMELEVGEKMSFYGAGYTEVTGMETVGGREGYVCKMYSKEDDGTKNLMAIWTIDPELAYPIKSIAYDNDEVMSEVTLIGYTKY